MRSCRRCITRRVRVTHHLCGRLHVPRLPRSSSSSSDQHQQQQRSAATRPSLLTPRTTRRFCILFTSSCATDSGVRRQRRRVARRHQRRVARTHHSSIHRRAREHTLCTSFCFPFSYIFCIVCTHHLTVVVRVRSHMLRATHESICNESTSSQRMMTCMG